MGIAVHRRPRRVSVDHLTAVRLALVTPLWAAVRLGTGGYPVRVTAESALTVGPRSLFGVDSDPDGRPVCYRAAFAVATLAGVAITSSGTGPVVGALASLGTGAVVTVTTAVAVVFDAWLAAATTALLALVERRDRDDDFGGTDRRRHNVIVRRRWCVPAVGF